MKAQKIINRLLLDGKTDLPRWSKDEFVLTAMQEFNICKKTAQKVYDGYHAEIERRRNK